MTRKKKNKTTKIKRQKNPKTTSTTNRKEKINK